MKAKRRATPGHGVDTNSPPHDSADVVEMIAEAGAPDTESIADTAAHDDLIGTTIARNFRLVRRIGSGGMGRVYEAEQLSLRKRVAVKVLRRELMGDERAVTRFEMEARAASAVNHPNMVQIIDCGHDTKLDVVYIAMELLQGLDLSQIIARDWPLPLHRTAYIIDDVLAALEEAHEQGIVHRDLKPANIILTRRRNQSDLVKVLDFGIAKAPAHADPRLPTLAGFVFGTPEYMAPEQARGAAVDRRADLYAVAAIMYQLVTGEVPFPAPSPTEVMVRVLRDEPERPSVAGRISLPARFEELLMRGLAKRPEDRPQTAAQFRDELRASLAGVVDHWPGQSGSLLVQTATMPPPASPLTPSSAVTPPPKSPPRGRAGSLAPQGMAAPGHAAGFAPEVGPVSLRPRATGRVWLLGAAVAIGGIALAMANPTWRALARGWVSGSSGASAPVDATRPRNVVGQGSVERGAATRPSGTTTIEEAPESAKDGVALVGEPSAAEPVETAPAAGSGGGARHERHDRSGKRAAQAAARSGRRGSSSDRRDQTEGRSVAAISDRGAPAAAPPASAPVAEPTSAAVVPPPVAAADAASKPAAPTASDVMKDAERLLAEGEIAPACRKAEEARRMSPRVPAVYKFLGKCYMRAGNAKVATESYRRYLELAPDAPDADFIRSYVK